MYKTTFQKKREDRLVFSLNLSHGLKTVNGSSPFNLKSHILYRKNFSSLKFQEMAALAPSRILSGFSARFLVTKSYEVHFLQMIENFCVWSSMGKA